MLGEGRTPLYSILADGKDSLFFKLGEGGTTLYSILAEGKDSLYFMLGEGRSKEEYHLAHQHLSKHIKFEPNIL